MWSYRYTPDGRSPRSLVSQSTGQALSRTTLRRADGSHREHGIRWWRGAVPWSISVLLTRGGGLLCVQSSRRRRTHHNITQCIRREKERICVLPRVCVCVCVLYYLYLYASALHPTLSTTLCTVSLTTGRVRNRYTKRAFDKTKCHTWLLCRHCMCWPSVDNLFIFL